VEHSAAIVRGESKAPNWIAPLAHSVGLALEVRREMFECRAAAFQGVGDSTRDVDRRALSEDRFEFLGQVIVDPVVELRLRPGLRRTLWRRDPSPSNHTLSKPQSTDGATATPAWHVGATHHFAHRLLRIYTVTHILWL
jgi:hypothetical protein